MSPEFLAWWESNNIRPAQADATPLSRDAQFLLDWTIKMMCSHSFEGGRRVGFDEGVRAEAEAEGAAAAGYACPSCKDSATGCNLCTGSA